jgi:hypothetical protein
LLQSQDRGVEHHDDDELRHPDGEERDHDDRQQRHDRPDDRHDAHDTGEQPEQDRIRYADGEQDQRADDRHAQRQQHLSADETADDFVDIRHERDGGAAVTPRYDADPEALDRLEVTDDQQGQTQYEEDVHDRGRCAGGDADGVGAERPGEAAHDDASLPCVLRDRIAGTCRQALQQRCMRRIGYLLLNLRDDMRKVLTQVGRLRGDCGREPCYRTEHDCAEDDVHDRSRKRYGDTSTHEHLDRRIHDVGEQNRKDDDDQRVVNAVEHRREHPQQAAHGKRKAGDDQRAQQAPSRRITRWFGWNNHGLCFPHHASPTVQPCGKGCSATQRATIALARARSRGSCYPGSAAISRGRIYGWRRSRGAAAP